MIITIGVLILGDLNYYHWMNQALAALPPIGWPPRTPNKRCKCLDGSTPAAADRRPRVRESLFFWEMAMGQY